DPRGPLRARRGRRPAPRPAQLRGAGRRDDGGRHPARDARRDGRRPELNVEASLPAVDTLDTRQFVIAVKRLADTLAYGTDHSRFLGSGIEFVQSRPYQYGDPVRAIDWRVTARTGRVHVKDFEAPKRMPCWLLIDTSASMTVSSVRRSKYAVALQIAGGLAFACLDLVSPDGDVGLSDREFRMQPSLSKDQVMQWLMRLRRYRFDEGTRLGRAITELRPSLRNRSLVIVLSDLHDDRALPALKLLNQEHECVVVQLQDPAETGVRGAGIVRAQE